MRRVAFLIRSLDVGGGERQLLELVRTLDRRVFVPVVVTFYDGGALRPAFTALPDVQVYTLAKQSRWDVGGPVRKLVQCLRCVQPALIVGFMGVANELALVAGRMLKRPVVWELRSSDVDFSMYDWFSRASFAIAARLSRFADAVIVNSEAGRRHHIGAGYDGRRMVVIPNGIDTERFRLDVDGRRRVRSEWHVADDEQVVGLVARIDPIKGHHLFLNAASRCSRRNVRFVSVGHGSPDAVARLKAAASALGVGDRVMFAGPRQDMAAVYSAFDLAVCASSSEGFPNVVAESMACGVRCVVTDVGDARRIVDDDRLVVPVGDPVALADAIEAQLQTPGDTVAVRRRIVERFTVERMTSASTDLFDWVVSQRARARQ